MISPFAPVRSMYTIPEMRATLMVTLKHSVCLNVGKAGGPNLMSAL